MTVDTKTVTNRRQVSYQSYDDLLADAEQLASGQAQTLGNWSLGQIFGHVAVSLESSIDGIPFRAPWAMRVVAQLFMKRKLLRNPVPPGYKIPSNAAKFQPDESISTEQGLASLRHAIERCKTEAQRTDHPVFGKLSRDEWDMFNLRHAELHMSFAAAT